MEGRTGGRRRGVVPATAGTVLAALAILDLFATAGAVTCVENGTPVSFGTVNMGFTYTLFAGERVGAHAWRRSRGTSTDAEHALFLLAGVAQRLSSRTAEQLLASLNSAISSS